MDWMRVDNGFIDHVKHRRLAHRIGVSRDEAVCVVLRLWSWCARCREDGDLSDLEPCDLADITRHDGDPDELLEALVAAGWVDRDGDEVRVHDWLDRQPLLKRRLNRENAEVRDVDATSTGRVRDVDATSTGRLREEKPPRARTDRQTDKQTNEQTSPHSPPKGDDVTWVFDAWNDAVAGTSLRRVVAVSGKRRRAAQTRSREVGFREGWPEACKAVAASPLWNGDNERGWIGTVDSLLRAGRWQEALEGKYTPKHDKGRTAQAAAAERVEHLRRELEAARRKGLDGLAADLESEIAAREARL